MELETITSVPLHVGAGYSGDPDWPAVYDLDDPAVTARMPFGVTDHLARAWLNGEHGWGLFEHASMGRHDPSGFADWSSVAR